MKIAFYVGELPTTTFINRLAEGLVKHGVEVTLFGLKKKNFKNSKMLKACGPKDGSYEGRLGRFIHFIKYAFLLKLRLNSEKLKIDRWLLKEGKGHWAVKSIIYPIIYYKPDVLHVQWAKSVGMFEWAETLNLKMVVSLRGAHINYSPLTTPGLAEMYRRVFPKVNAFHGVSKAIINEAEKYGVAKNKCHLVYSGFDLQQFCMNMDTSKFQSLRGRPIQIISVGRSHWIKGYHHALDAMYLLKKQGVDFKYIIIGAEGAEELEFQNIQLGLEDYVELLGSVSPEEVKKRIGEGDVLLLPSVEEGIANVALEAMLLGTFVVSTNCGGLKEVVEDGITGFVVPIRSPTAMAEAIVKVKTSKPDALIEILMNARKKLEKQHSEEKMINGMLELYKNVIAK